MNGLTFCQFVRCCTICKLLVNYSFFVEQGSKTIVTEFAKCTYWTTQVIVMYLIIYGICDGVEKFISIKLMRTMNKQRSIMNHIDSTKESLLESPSFLFVF